MPAMPTNWRASFLGLLSDQLDIDDPLIRQNQPWGELAVFASRRDKGTRCHVYMIRDLSAAAREIAHVPLQFAARDTVLVCARQSEKTGRIRRGNSGWRSLERRFGEAGLFPQNRFAVYPDPRMPRYCFELNKYILGYVELVSHRCADHPILFYLKKAMLQLKGISAWTNWKITAFQTNTTNSLLHPLQSRYIFQTPDRQIGLVFAYNKQTPMYVEKKGPAIDLQEEWKNHQWAFQKLGKLVPAILNFSLSEDQACIRLEYIPEITLLNRIANAFFRNHARETEITAAFDFFQTVFDKLMNGLDLEKQDLPQEVRETVQQGIDYFLSGEASPAMQDHLKSVAKKIVRVIRFPLIPQHGDFCVRNILYRTKSEHVLIDWEDFHPAMLPLVDWTMLRISLAKTWTMSGRGSNAAVDVCPKIRQAISRLTGHMQRKLDMNKEEWQLCGICSLAYLAGHNLRKQRSATARKIRDAFYSQASEAPNQQELA